MSFDNPNGARRPLFAKKAGYRMRQTRAFVSYRDHLSIADGKCEKDVSKAEDSEQNFNWSDRRRALFEWHLKIDVLLGFHSNPVLAGSEHAFNYLINKTNNGQLE